MSNSIDTRHDMLRVGYRKLSDAKCKGCGAAIEWWRTNNGKKTPFNPIADDNVQTVPHWATCPDSARFQPQPSKPAANRRAIESAADRTAAVQQLLDSTRALAVVTLYAEGPVLAWVDGLTGDEYRHEFITAANLLRQNVDARAAEKKQRTA